MAESSGFGEIVGCAANGGELKPLRSLVIEKRDLLVVGAANPSIGHDVRHGADVGIIDFMVRRQRYFVFLFDASGDVAEHTVAARRNSRGIAVGS